MNRPVLLLVESKRATFSEHVLRRSDIETVLLRLGHPSDRGATSDGAESGRPTFTLNDLAPLADEVRRYLEWSSQLDAAPTYFCNPNEAVQDAAQSFARGVGLPALSKDQVAQVHEKPAMKEMYDTLGIPNAAYRLVQSEDEIREFAESHGWPLILKPINSDTCIGTYKLTGTTDPDLARVRDAHFTWMVEEYISGSEFQLCALVQNGLVRGAYISKNPAPILDYLDGAINANITLAPSEEEPVDGVALAQRLVDGVGYENGYLHGEFFMRHDGQFVMGELAARLSGCEVPLNHGLAYGFDIMTAIANLYIGEVAEVHYTADRSVGDLLLPTKRGRVRAISAERELLALPGVLSATIRAKVGDELRPPRASSASSGFVQVEGASSDEVHARMDHVLASFVLDVDSSEI